MSIGFVVRNFIRHNVEFDMMYVNDEYSIHVILGNQEYVVPVNNTKKLKDMYNEVYQYYIKPNIYEGEMAMKKEVYGMYAPNYDITFIMEEYFTDEGMPISLEVKGFYYGTPDELNQKIFYSDLKAEFSDLEVQENAEN